MSNCQNGFASPLLRKWQEPYSPKMGYDDDNVYNLLPSHAVHAFASGLNGYHFMSTEMGI